MKRLMLSIIKILQKILNTISSRIIILLKEIKDMISKKNLIINIMIILKMK